MFTMKDRVIANQKVKINNRDKFIEKQSIENRQLKEENVAIYEENRDLRFENNELRDLINEFVKELYSNIKTDKQKVEKLKEVIRRQTI